MKEYIKKLQAKPESVRKQILVGSLIVCMSLVCLVWVGSLGYRFGSSEAQTAQDNSKNGMKPFALLGETITDTYDNITASVGNISQTKEKVKEEVREVEEKQVDLIPVETEVQ